MDWLWGASREQIALGVLTAIAIGALGLIPKAIVAVASRIRRVRISKYSAATSFGDAEILSALDSYVRPQCMKVDPASKGELREALELESQSLFEYVEGFIEKSDTKFLFILADCGMGKTSFLINYFHENRAKFFSPNGRRIKLVSLARAAAQGEIEAVPREDRKSTVLLLDALDEDPLVIGEPLKRIRLIFQLSEDFKAVVVTCRSQFFASDEDIPAGTGVVRAGVTKPGGSKQYSLDRIYIAPFNDKAIRKYLSKELRGVLNFIRRRRARRIVDKTPYLSVRPMLLAHISDIVSERIRLESQSDIYQAMVSAWVKREDHWVNPKQLLDFSKLLAFDLYTNREIRGGEMCKPQEISEMARRWKADIKTEHLTGRSLLNRYADGNFKFAHRSILEYFVAQTILGSPAGLSLAVTDQIMVFMLDELGCMDGFSESSVIRSRGICVDVVSPQIRIGYGTNYDLYRRRSNALDINEIFRMSVDLGGRYEGCLFGEYIQAAFRYAETSGQFVDARVNVLNRESADYVDAYLSVWFESVVVLGRFRLALSELSSVLGSPRSELGEAVFVGLGSPYARSAENLTWSDWSRCEIIPSRGVDIRTFQKNSGVGFLRDTSSGNLTMSVIAGSQRQSALSSFGIISGGSSYALETKKFVKLHGYRGAELDVGREIPQQQPIVPPSERWPERAR